MANDTIRIGLADDEELFRKGIAFILEREEDFEVVFEAENGQKLLDTLATMDDLPDVVLTDLKMPMVNGIEATKAVLKKYPAIKVIALTSYNTRGFIANMVDIGAAAFLVKNSTPKTVKHTVREVVKRGFYYNYQVMQIIQDELQGASSRSLNEAEELTTREKEILQLICDQLTTHEIAEKLFISPRTVEGHRNNLLQKTESKNVAGLVLFAIRHNLVILDKGLY
ncbi:response regulator transcription factor [Gilvibacter sediminis]|uniref:response regulator transcription factor n=1 Tax=Gilvibacter sediminis TaxID=379071 RepID=UPI00235033D4|nr:response regulator transcription factor [Gilvibacter sediminis]MDC7998097.1 response regulator transcription factor [Gilvibacter sediminis]